MSLPVDTVVWLYSYLLAPIPALAELGFPVSAIDVIGTLRLALAVQQIKYGLKLRDIGGVGQVKRAIESEEKGHRVTVESRFRADTAMSSIWAMFVIVYGGELFVSSFISQPPSFFTAPTGPAILALGHFLVSGMLQYTPQLLPLQPSLKWELPLAVVDAFTRAMLLCSISPSTIVRHPSSSIADSGTALLLTSTVLANGGFFIVNSLSMLSPSGWAVSTPPELLPGGWTSLDLLSAPFVTALYATLTGAQTTWREASTYVGYSLSNSTMTGINEKPMIVGNAFSPDEARAICVLILIGGFSSRAVKNFGGLQALQGIFRAPAEKTKTQ